MTESLLAFADGTVFHGQALGASGRTAGELVFNTALTGYQEILTDPSYHGQIVTMTYPHQGNYGVNAGDAEAGRPWVKGFVVREATHTPSSWTSEQSLEDYLVRHGIVGIRGIDTRALTRRLRSQGAMVGAIASDGCTPDELVEWVRRQPGLEGRDLVAEVSPAEAYDASAALADWSGIAASQDPSVAPLPAEAAGARVAAMDYGMKRSILRCLAGAGLDVRVFPASATATDVLSWNPDGVFLSNGPGDPSALPYAVKTIRGVLESRTPVFGICLGHQLLGTALGASTYKLKFGHRGANHPVKSLDSGRVEITSHNHGYAVATGVDPGSAGEPWQVLAKSKAGDWRWTSDYGEVALTHFDLNDGTLEGFRCLDLPALGVQYHPEAAPGPHDSRYLFGDFVDLIAASR